jgi:hypothetical protein
MMKETSFADFVFQVRHTCGKKAIVVNVPATIPRIVKKSMQSQFKIQN